MKISSKAQIENVRAYLDSLDAAVVKASVGDFSYYVVPGNVGPLKNFAMQLSGPSGYLVGVSEEIPLQFRDFVAFHEWIEFSSFRGEYASCRKSLEAELQLVPNVQLQQYSAMRRDFFQDLVEYASRNNYSARDIKRFSQSLSLLLRLQ